MGWDCGGLSLGEVRREGGARNPTAALASALVGARKHPGLWQPRGKPRGSAGRFFGNSPQFPRSQTRIREL